MTIPEEATTQQVSDARYVLELDSAVRKLMFVAMTTGGVAGRDDGLAEAIDEVARVLSLPGRMESEQIADAKLVKLTKELRIAELRNKGSLANNLCSDHRDKQTGQPCLACTIETLERKLNSTQVGKVPHA